MAKRQPKTTFSIIALAISLLVLLGILYFVKIDIFWAWLLAWSAVAFGLYGYDKAQAKMGGGRVPEIVLHLATLIGGWPGAWGGRYVFRHKIRKPVFLVILIISTVLWVGVGYWYFVIAK